MARPHSEKAKSYDSTQEKEAMFIRWRSIGNRKVVSGQRILIVEKRIDFIDGITIMMDNALIVRHCDRVF